MNPNFSLDQTSAEFGHLSPSHRRSTLPDERTRIRDYAAQYQSDYGFEYHMVRARQQLILHLLAELRPRSVLEIGCEDEHGLNLLSHHLVGAAKIQQLG